MRFFWVLGLKLSQFLMSILNWQVNSSSNFASFFIFMTQSSSVNFNLMHFILWIKGLHQRPILRLSSALVKIFQIPHAIFQTSSQLYFKFYMILQCHILICYILCTERINESGIFDTFECSDQNSPNSCSLKCSFIYIWHEEFREFSPSQSKAGP